MATQKETIVDHFDRDITEDILNDIVGSLDILKLRYCRLSCEKWKQLANKDDFHEAQQLILDYTDLHNNVGGLAACIVNKKVRKLSLINTRVTKDDLELFEKELSTMESSQIFLHSLNLMHNKIEPGGFEVLAKILNLMPVVQEVDATNCKLNDGAIKTFHSTLSKEKRIRSLILSQNDQITPEGMVYAGNIAEKCETKSLGFSCCCLEDEHLSKIMETSPESLTRLDLSDNMKLSAQTVTKLSQKWRSLENIDVRECWLSAEDITLLQKNIEPCQVISDNPSGNDEGEITWTVGIDYESVPSDVDFGEIEPEEDTLKKPEIKSVVEESTPAVVQKKKTFHHKTTVDLYNSDITEDTLNEAVGFFDTVKLHNCRMNRNFWKQLVNNDKFLEIRQLVLYHTDPHNNVDGLAACIVNKKVRKLSLINSSITKDDLVRFDKELALEDASEILLHSLNLMHSEIEPGSFEVLANILNLMPVVEEVDVTNCQLTDGAIKTFHSAISKGKHIRSLILSQNGQITPKGIPFVGKIAEKCNTERLGLSGCGLEDEHLRKIMETSPESLLHLGLSDNMKLSTQSVADLAKKWTHLETIDVTECWFSAEAIKELQKNIEPCKVISDKPSRKVEREFGPELVGIDYESKSIEEIESEKDTLGAILDASEVARYKAPPQVQSTGQRAFFDVTTAVTNIQVTRSTNDANTAHLHDNRIYPIARHRRKGRVLIINNEFLETPENRLGSEVDVRNLEELWTELGFAVVPVLNLTARQMLKTCWQFARETRDVSVVVVIIMSHGEKATERREYFLGEDHERVLVDDVIYFFNATESPHLRGIPKLFLFEAGRGPGLDLLIHPLPEPPFIQEGSDMHVSFPTLSGKCAFRVEAGRGPEKVEVQPSIFQERSDMLVSFPTLSGNCAMRNICTGSWHMNAITHVFMQRAHDTHVLDMLTMVNNAVSRRITEYSVIQSSNQLNYFRRSLFLFPGWPN